MAQLQTNELEALLSVMQKMHDAACNLDWETLSALEHDRRGIIKFSEESGHKAQPRNAKAQPAALADQDTKKLVANILELDKKIRDKANEARNELVKKNRELSSQVKAKAGYEQARSFR